MTFVPESANRQDWPRLVAQAVNKAQSRLKKLEAGGTVGTVGTAFTGGGIDLGTSAGPGSAGINLGAAV